MRYIWKFALLRDCANGMLVELVDAKWANGSRGYAIILYDFDTLNFRLRHEKRIYKSSAYLDWMFLRTFEYSTSNLLQHWARLALTFGKPQPEMEDSPQAVQKGDQDSSKQLSPGSVSTLPAKNRPGRRKRAFVLCQACCVDLKNLKTYYKVLILFKSVWFQVTLLRSDFVCEGTLNH